MTGVLVYFLSVLLVSGALLPSQVIAVTSKQRRPRDGAATANPRSNPGVRNPRSGAGTSRPRNPRSDTGTNNNPRKPRPKPDDEPVVILPIPEPDPIVEPEGDGIYDHVTGTLTLKIRGDVDGQGQNRTSTKRISVRGGFSGFTVCTASFPSRCSTSKTINLKGEDDDKLYIVEFITNNFIRTVEDRLAITVRDQGSDPFGLHMVQSFTTANTKLAKNVTQFNNFNNRPSGSTGGSSRPRSTRTVMSTSFASDGPRVTSGSLHIVSGSLVMYFDDQVNEAELKDIADECLGCKDPIEEPEPIAAPDGVLLGAPEDPLPI